MIDYTVRRLEEGRLATTAMCCFTHLFRTGNQQEKHQEMLCFSNNTKTATSKITWKV